MARRAAPIEVIDLTEDSEVSILSAPRPKTKSIRPIPGLGKLVPPPRTQHHVAKPTIDAHVQTLSNAIVDSSRRTNIPINGSNDKSKGLPMKNHYPSTNGAWQNKVFPLTTNGSTPPTPQKPPPSKTPAADNSVARSESPDDDRESKRQLDKWNLMSLDICQGTKWRDPIQEDSMVTNKQMNANKQKLGEQRRPLKSKEPRSTLKPSSSMFNVALDKHTGLGFGSFQPGKDLPPRRGSRSRRDAYMANINANYEEVKSRLDGPVRRSEPPSANPRTRKVPSPRPSSEAPVSTTGGAAVLPERVRLSTDESSKIYSRTRPLLLPPQSPGPMSQCWSKYRSPRIESGDDPPGAIHSLSTSAPRNTTDGSTSSPSGLPVPRLESAMASKDTVQNMDAQFQETNVDLASGHNSPDAESSWPTTSSFPPEFDRGRFPYQRRRRGARGAPNPWVSKGHHKQPSSNSVTIQQPEEASSSSLARFPAVGPSQGSAHREHTLPKDLIVPSGIHSASLEPYVSLDGDQGQHGDARPRPINTNNAFKYPQRIVEESRECDPPLVNEGKSRRHDPGPTPNYLGSLRTRGWHHDGYAEVKELFTTIASDTVHRERQHYITEPIDIDLVTGKVTDEANELARKRFGHFVNRLNKTSTAVPNSNDVDWLQREVAKTFRERAEIERMYDEMRAVGVDRSRNLSPSVLHQHDLAWGNASPNHEASSVSEPLTSRSSGSTSFTETSPPTELPGASSESHQKYDETTSDRRPRRSAAQTATSLITSQYGIRPVAGDFQADAATNLPPQSSNIPRKLCQVCDRMISVLNFKVHLGTKIHKQNERLAGARGQQPSRDETIEHGLWHGDVQSTAPTLVAKPRQPDTSLSEPEFAIPSVSKSLQAQRKSVQGTFLTSLAASIAVEDSQTQRLYQERESRGKISPLDRQRLLFQNRFLQHVDLTADDLASIKELIPMDSDDVDFLRKNLAKFSADKDGFIVQKKATQAIMEEIMIAEGHLEPLTTRKFVMAESHVQDPVHRPTRCVGSLLRHRELGASSGGRHVETRSELSIRMTERIKPWRSFAGASHDVVSVAWAPNSMQFAAGAVAHSNPEDLQYNRPCNLLYGDLLVNTIRELPDHRIDRQMPQTGPNAANRDLFNACDPKVYKTVTSVKFDLQDKRMYTASEDMTVKLWDLSTTAPRCIQTVQDDANVTSLDVSQHQSGVFASASHKIRQSIRVARTVDGHMTSMMLSSSRAELKPEWEIYPECLHWSPTSHTSHLLLGGFQEYGRDVGRENEGHLCLWDVNTGQDLKLMPAAQAIHAAAWHPSLPYLASGGSPGFEKTDRLKTRTAVRVWDLRHIKRVSIEYECAAREMTDVTFCPIDPNIVTAGCTDSRSYVWDWRWPQEPVHKLSHSQSIMPSGERDTGVMMSSWGPGASLYYTGSSDGSVRAWDVRRHPNDVHVHTVAQLDAGIQSGKFSPDGTHLLLGDATGQVHVLSSAPWAPHPSESISDDVTTKGTPFDVIRAPDGSGNIDTNEDDPGIEGILAAQHLVITEQVAIDPEYGPGKGPNYNGPYAMDVRRKAPNKPDHIGRLDQDVFKKQPFSFDRENPEIRKIRPVYADPIRTLVAARRYTLDRQNEAHGGDVDMFGSAATILQRGHSMTGIQDEGSLEVADPTENAAPTTDGQMMLDAFPETHVAASCVDSVTQNHLSSDDAVVTDQSMSESEMVEENGWWPRLGEEEIAQARARPWLRLG